MVKIQDQSTDRGMLLGVIREGRGIGSVLSGPLSKEVLRRRSWEQRFIYPSLSYPGYSARIGLSKFQARIRIG